VFRAAGRRVVRRVVIREALVVCYFAIVGAWPNQLGIKESLTGRLRAFSKKSRKH